MAEAGIAEAVDRERMAQKLTFVHESGMLLDVDVDQSLIA